MVFAQRSLIDLIDVLNPNRSVFPNTDERGKLPLPSGFSEPTKARPLEHLASFYNDLGWDPFDEWVGANHLEANKDAWVRSVSSGRRAAAVSLVMAEQGETSLTLRGWAEPPAWARAAHLVPENYRWRAAAGGLCARESARADWQTTCSNATTGHSCYEARLWRRQRFREVIPRRASVP
jgi:hypothetical protein